MESTPASDTPSQGSTLTGDTATKSESFDSSSDEEAASELYYRQMRHMQRQGRNRTTVVYTSEDLKKVRSPWLKFGDEKAKSSFDWRT